MNYFKLDSRPPSLRTWEGLHSYLESQLAPHPQLGNVHTLDTYTALSPADRAEFDDQRLAALSAGSTFETRSVAEAKKRLIQCFQLNRTRTSGNSGLLLTGDSTVGKTTLAKTLMVDVQRNYKKAVPDFREHGHVPIVFIDVPAGSTGKALMTEFARFFGLTVGRGEPMTSIRARVVDLMNEVRTQLVVVDELHNLATNSRGSFESVDLLKTLHNELGATFVYAGIDLLNGHLLAGARGQQIAGRFTTVELRNYSRSDPQQVSEWRKLVRAFEANLTLLEHEARSLDPLMDYIYERTSGSIGSLARLLTGAAQQAILGEGPERLTEKLLDSIVLDQTAQSMRETTRARMKRAAPTPDIGEFA